ISAYDNVDTTNPINASGGQVSSSTPSITTTVANTMLVACFGRSSGAAVGAPSGMTERFHAESSNGSNDSASESADAAQAAAGATGQKASTGNTANISQLLALAPQSTCCLADTVQAAGTSCTDDGNVCTPDVCNGTVGAPACSHAAGNAGTVCGAAEGGCDVAGTCTGTSATCPTDDKQPAGTACTDDTNPCTLDQCDGSTNTCTHPAGNAGTVCRAAAGECDLAESCTGTSTTCPTDAFKT